MQFPNSFRIIVKTNASKTELLGFDEEKQAYRIAVKAPPRQGKANQEIVQFFSKLLKTNVQIVKGVKNKEKVLKTV